METGAGFESREIAGEKEGLPETCFSREKREEAVEEMGGCLKHEYWKTEDTTCIQLRPLKAAQRISEYKRWP